MFCKQIVYNFSTNNKYDNEWENLQAQVLKYTKLHETNNNGIIFFKKLKIIPCINVLFINIEIFEQ